MIRNFPEIVAQDMSRDYVIWLADLVRYLDESKTGLGVHQTARDVFTVPDGGTLTGTYDTNIQLPNNAIIIRAWYDVTETFQSGTDAATIAIGIETDDAAGIVAAIAISDGGNPWDNGPHDCIQDGAAANAAEKTTATRTVQITVAAENLTEGELVLFLEYVVSKADV
jgi:hypothetical protein